MDYFVSLRLTPNIMRILNSCRLFLQVITVSDISSVDGKYILPQVKAGVPIPYRNSTLEWPIQGRLLPSEWSIWRNHLAYLEDKGRLITPLGAWTGATHQRWNTHFNLEDQSLFLRENNTTNIYHPVARSRGPHTRSSTKPLYDLSHPQLQTAPAVGPLVPATIQLDSFSRPYVYIDYSPNLPPTTSTNPPKYQPKFMRQICKLVSHQQLLLISDTIKCGKLVVTTDGSYNPITTKVSCSWVFNSGPKTIYSASSKITAANRNAYRAELLGLLATLTIIQQVEEKHPVTTGKFTLISDCKKAL